MRTDRRHHSAICSELKSGRTHKPPPTQALRRLLKYQASPSDMAPWAKYKQFFRTYTGHHYTTTDAQKDDIYLTRLRDAFYMQLHTASINRN
jgi:hypothetical protein